MNVIDAIKGRASVRAYLDRPVPRDTVEAILEAARWAPSGVNMQPWQVAVLGGESLRRLGDTFIAARERGEKEHLDYGYYPEQWSEPYRSRRFACGMALYSALGIERGDSVRRKQAWYRNYRFFDAPIGLMFFIRRDLATGSWLDYGMFLQNVMLAAREFGLETCPEASMAEFPDLVREQLQMPPEWLVVCGIALGYPDREHPVNGYRTTREPVEGFTRWYD